MSFGRNPDATPTCSDCRSRETALATRNGNLQHDQVSIVGLGDDKPVWLRSWEAAEFRPNDFLQFAGVVYPSNGCLFPAPLDPVLP